MEPAGCGTVSMLQAVPFQPSAKDVSPPALPVASPTAWQALGDGQATDRSPLALVPGGTGLGRIVQLAPFQVSTRVLVTPVLDVENPTAVHASADGHATPSNSLADAPIGLGVDSSVQPEPFSLSAQVTRSPVGSTWSPTAVHDELTQASAVRVPEGTVGLGVVWSDQGLVVVTAGWRVRVLHAGSAVPLAAHGSDESPAARACAATPSPEVAAGAGLAPTVEGAKTPTMPRRTITTATGAAAWAANVGGPPGRRNFGSRRRHPPDRAAGVGAAGVGEAQRRGATMGSSPGDRRDSSPSVMRQAYSSRVDGLSAIGPVLCTRYPVSMTSRPRRIWGQIRL